MDYKKSAQNACELLAQWSGDTVLPYSEFSQIMERAYAFNQQVATGGLVVLSAKEYEDLLANQKKRR